MDKLSMDNAKIRPIEERDSVQLNELFGPSTKFGKKKNTWKEYFEQTKNNERLTIVAEANDNVVGFATLKLKSNHLPFLEHNIPEINDLNVVETYRNRGYGSKLTEFLEGQARSRGYKTIGIGVGLYKDYGAAQRLYVKMGYIPDGHGVTYDNKLIKPGETVRVDDQLVLWFTKEL